MPVFRCLRRLVACLFVLSCAAPAWATDTFNTSTQEITIPSVVLGNDVYTNVVVKLGSVLALGGGQPYGTCDSYAPVTNQLTIPSVQVNGTTYANVLVTLALPVVQVGGRLANAAPTYCYTPARNVLPLVVDQGPAGLTSIATNEPFVSVTVCSPGSTSACQTIDHVLVDTGSVGLRLISSALTPGLLAALPQARDSSGYALAECVAFASNSSWGSVRTADVQLAGEKASALPIQVIGDPAFSQVPAGCSGNAVMEDTVASFGANGVLGIQPFLQDCGSTCSDVTLTQYWMYWICPGGACQVTAVTPDRQLSNPVAMLAAGNDNNGVVLALPSVPATGSVSATGTLTLGIATAANNSLGNALIYDLDPYYGNFTTVFGGQSYTDASFVDSGSNALYFADGFLSPCSSTGPASGFFCPSGTVALSAVNQGYSNGNSGTVRFSVADAESLFIGSPYATAFDNLAGSPIPGNFDWGLPFFFGRSVFMAFEQRYTVAGNGPYVAY
ncbi:MAG: DUF3443 domain-containing protein [Betaproteobacteria bacterium]|nr:DUF3443 domain-containing protein [Betaproteobacteria bacterium]